MRTSQTFPRPPKNTAELGVGESHWKTRTVFKAQPPPEYSRLDLGEYLNVIRKQPHV